MTLSESSWSGGNDLSFKRLDGPLSRSYGPVELHEDVRGYRVIGFAGSSEVRAGYENKQTIFGDWELTLQSRRFVVALGVKLFPTKEEAKKWAHEMDEQPDP